MKPGKGPARAWDTGIMRRGVSELNLVTPHPSPLLPAVSQGLRHRPNPRKKWLWAPRFGTRICGERGAIWEPPSCESWLQGSGWGWFVWRAAGGVWAECPKSHSVVLGWRENGSVWDHEPARKNSGITALWMLPSHLCSQSIPSGKFCTSPRL